MKNVTLEQVEAAAFKAFGEQIGVEEHPDRGTFTVHENQNDDGGPVYELASGKVLGFLRAAGKARKDHIKDLKTQAKELTGKVKGKFSDGAT